jgi:hypothetical protein
MRTSSGLQECTAGKACTNKDVHDDFQFNFLHGVHQSDTNGGHRSVLLEGYNNRVHERVHRSYAARRFPRPIEYRDRNDPPKTRENVTNPEKWKFKERKKKHELIKHKSPRERVSERSHVVRAKGTNTAVRII